MELKISENLKVLNYLNATLMTRTWFACKQLTLADIHMFCSLYRQQYLKLFGHFSSYYNITRWYKHMNSLPAFVNAIARVREMKKTLLPIKPIKIRKQEGKFIDLPEAEMGKVKLYSTMKHIGLIFKLL